MDIQMSEEEYLEHTHNYDGICVGCGEIMYGCVEPDAEGYECEACGEEKVYGVEQALLLDYIQIIE